MHEISPEEVDAIGELGSELAALVASGEEDLLEARLDALASDETSAMVLVAGMHLALRQVCNALAPLDLDDPTVHAAIERRYMVGWKAFLAGEDSFKTWLEQTYLECTYREVAAILAVMIVALAGLERLPLPGQKRLLQ